MKNSNSKIGLENRALTPALFKSNFNTMRERVKTYLSIKYKYSVTGNKVTAQSVEDYLQNGLERLIGSFDFENCLFNNETITIYGFQKLWFYLSQQSVYADNVRSTMSKKGVETKIVVSNIVTQLDGKESVTNIVENRLLEIDSDNTKVSPTMNVRKIVRKAIENAETKSDKKFYERVLAHLIIQSSIRKADNVRNAITLKEVIDCFENQFDNVGAYIMFRTRMESDIRIKRLKKVA
jgi:hypothetical protein